MRVFIPALMRYLRPVFTCLGLVLGLGTSSLALAQPDDGDEAPSEEMEAGEGEAPGGDAAPTPVEQVEMRERFPVRRGLYVLGDFGGYFSFGGRANEPGLSSRTVSNFQPYIGLSLGYDLVSTESVNWAAGVRWAVGYNAGSARISNADATSAAADPRVAASLETLPADFGIHQVGVGTKLGFMALDRLAINVVADGGLAILTPDPTVPGLAPEGGNSPDGGSAGFGVNFGVGVGVEFYTLFPGVAVGLETKFVGTIVSSEFIPGMSITVPLKYNF